MRSSRWLALAGMLMLAPAMAATPAAAEDFDCIIEAAQTVEIRSPVTGLLQKVHARRGETVREGQLLVTIESSVERSAADSARFRAEAQGAAELARAKVSALREKSRRLAELQAEDQLRRRQIHAPFTGVVVDQYLFPGALVDAGDSKKPILKIAQTQPLAVPALLPLRLFPRVAVGQAVSVTPEAPFQRPISARIRTVDRVVDAAAGTFGIVAALDNTRQQLPAGLRCKLAIAAS